MKNHTRSGDRRSVSTVVSWIVLLTFLVTTVLPLPALAGDAVFYYHNDPTGSPVAITDAAGNKVWSADYEPFGELAGLVENVPNNQQFLAKTVDPETSLHLLGARYYDGKLGRFLSVDPGLLRGQQASTLGRGQFHNVYAYSANNPYRFVDPSGNTPIDLAFLAVDVAKLGFAVYTGVGISAAVVDVGLSIAGVVSPVAGTGEVLKAGRAAEHAAEVVRGADHGLDVARGGLSEARAARDTLSDSLAPLKGNAPATVTAGINTKTGEVAARACGGGKCAENHVVDALGGVKGDIKFTEAVRPRTGREVPVCPKCESTFGRDAFPPGTQFKSDFP